MEMTSKEDFIRVYDNALSTEFCNGAINYFEWCLANNKTWNRTEATANYKKDTSTSLNPVNTQDILFSSDNLGHLTAEFNDVFWNTLWPDYAAQFDTLNSFDRMSIFTYKIQKTLPGGGYHIWHSEQGSAVCNKRVAVYTLYLNDVLEGGETEFLYQNTRVPPKQGRLCIFPAAYTHTHRGNPPLRAPKYLMTGWIEFA